MEKKNKTGKTERSGKTQIERRLRQKTNRLLVSAIISLKKTNVEVAKMLATPKKKSPSINLEYIEKNFKDGDKLLVAGKLLGEGTLTRKIKIVAWSASEKAKERMKKAKAEFVSIVDEMKKNPQLKDLKIVKCLRTAK